MTDLANPPYPPPLDQLLTLGLTADQYHDWPDYLALGLREEHVPELIRMATDPKLRFGIDPEGPQLWAPVHASRALGQLRAEAAVEPLRAALGEDEDDEWAFEEFPIIFSMIGRAAVPTLAAALDDPQAHGWVRIAAAEGLKLLALNDPEARESAVATLVAQLGRWRSNDAELNAFLIDYLADLHVMEAVPLMKEAFAAGAVDLSIRGDWEDAQVDLGLLAERPTPQESYPRAARIPRAPQPTSIALITPPTSRPGKGKAKTKNRRKMARASRKRNRSRR